MRISDWSSDVCSSDLITRDGIFLEQLETNPAQYLPDHEDKLSAEVVKVDLNQPMSEIRKLLSRHPVKTRLSLSGTLIVARSEEHTSELQSLMRISYAVFCLKKKKNITYTQ